MASFVFKDAEVRYGGLDMTGILNKVDLNYTADMEDASVFGTNSMIRLSGLMDTTVNQSGFWSDTADLELYNRIGATLPEVFSVAPQGVVDGPAFAMLGDQASYSLGGAVGEVHPFNVSIHSNGALVGGKLFIIGTKTVSGVSTIIELGAVPLGWAVYASLHVTVNGGTGDQTFDAIVESDDLVGFGTPTTRLTFDQVTTTNQGQWKSALGSITDTFWRVTFTITGTGSPTFDAFIVVGIAKV